MSNNDIFTDSGPELQPLIGPLVTFFPNQYFVHKLFTICFLCSHCLSYCNLCNYDYDIVCKGENVV